MIELLNNPRRIYIGRKTKRHVHHGFTGSVMVLIGLGLIATDLKDFPWRLIDDRDRYSRP